MIVFLYGRDGYRLKQNLEKIINEYQKKYSGLALSVLDLDEIGEFAKLEDTIKTVSFFGERSLVVLKNTFSCGAKIAELIKNWDLKKDKQRILVFVEYADEILLAKKDKELFSLLTIAPSIPKCFKTLEGKQLENWIAKEFKLAGVEAEISAISKLISFVGGDSWRLGQEILKLANYGGTSDAKKITLADVELLVHAEEDQNIFQIIDAIAAKNRLRATLLLHYFLERDDDPHYVFSMINYQFRNLLRVKSLMKNAMIYSAIIKKTGLNPFVVKKTQEQCRNYDLEELKQLYALLAQIDVLVKSGFEDMENGLFRFVFSVAGQGLKRIPNLLA